MLEKGVYPYEYIDDWKKINETLLPEHEDFYSHFNMEDITDAGLLWNKVEKKEHGKLFPVHW